MKRFGSFSGRIYEDNEVDKMQACGVCITDEQANDSDYIFELRTKHLARCMKCFGCPMAQQSLCN